MSRPYYIIPAVEEYLKSDPASPRARKLRTLICANIGDKDALAGIFGTDETLEEMPPKTSSETESMKKIDSFLEKFGTKTPASCNQGYVLEKETWAGSAEKTSDPFQKEMSRLIKARRYQDALKLIETQNLNNPQKSIYFAHQIRFLKKLIALDKYRNKTRD